MSSITAQSTSTTTRSPGATRLWPLARAKIFSTMVIPMTASSRGTPHRSRCRAIAATRRIGRGASVRCGGEQRAQLGAAGAAIGAGAQRLADRRDAVEALLDDRLLQRLQPNGETGADDRPMIDAPRCGKRQPRHEAEPRLRLDRIAQHGVK